VFRNSHFSEKAKFWCEASLWLSDLQLLVILFIHILNAYYVPTIMFGAGISQLKANTKFLSTRFLMYGEETGKLISLIECAT
jgi:hypothetical protein